MAKKPEISIATLNQAIQNAAVRQVLTNRAALMLPRARQEAAKAGRTRLAKALRIEHGTRPGSKSASGIKRPYVRLMADYPEEDQAADSRAKLTTREIMRRASR